jgi:hypothetical protein
MDDPLLPTRIFGYPVGWFHLQRRSADASMFFAALSKGWLPVARVANRRPSTGEGLPDLRCSSPRFESKGHSRRLFPCFCCSLYPPSYLPWSDRKAQNESDFMNLSTSLNQCRCDRAKMICAKITGFREAPPSRISLALTRHAFFQGVKFQQRYQMRHRKSRDEDALWGVQLCNLQFLSALTRTLTASFALRPGDRSESS